jgi:biopolymer transport protein ExbD
MGGAVVGKRIFASWEARIWVGCTELNEGDKMRRKKTGAERDNDSAKLDISSLIDVSFLLLVFFLAAMTLEKAEAELKMVLPGEGPGEPMLLPMLEVKVQPSGVILVNEEALEMDEGSRRLPRLYERLEEYKRLAKM